MEDRDISIKTNFGRYNYRVGAIIINDANLLMVKNSNAPYYYSVGGRVKFGESSTDAILREVFEETQIKFEIERLAFIHENFFIWEIDNEPFHEISLFYLMKQQDTKNIKCNTIGENGGDEELYWLPLNKLNQYQLYPEFFKMELTNAIESVGHFITKDNQTFRA